MCRLHKTGANAVRITIYSYKINKCIFVLYWMVLSVNGNWGRTVLVPCQQYSIQGVIFSMLQCHLVQKRCLEIICFVCAGKSKVPSMNKARFRLDVTRNGCIKPQCSLEHFVPAEHNTGLKHQRLRTAFSWKHIWNLPASLHFGNL